MYESVVVTAMALIAEALSYLGSLMPKSTSCGTVSISDRTVIARRAAGMANVPLAGTTTPLTLA
ncbi:MAG TPA: hypothetical protein VE439_10800 [Anaerolineae bacterium]|jgi:hypothetical protein|nr:hypothetical protein [Anaerolineae bacterium]